jgi:hypothetical protein
MYENGKTRPVETTSGMGEAEFRGEFMLYCKNFCKCHNVSPVQQ